MKRIKIILSLIFLSLVCHAQTTSIDQYSNHIDALLAKKALKIKKYHQMSRCGGSLTGYYLDNKLVYVNTVNGGELDVIETNWYLKNDALVKSIEKYSDNVPTEKSTSTKTTIWYGDKINLKRTSNNLVVKVSETEKIVEIERTKECFNILVEELNE